MIPYELAKKLKDAGFEQIKTGWCKHEVSPFDTGHDSCWKNKEYAYHPTLSELIDACGDDFNGIVKVMKKFYPEQSEWWWEAVSKKGYKYGDTPEESVANLWLFLNKKQCLK